MDRIIQSTLLAGHTHFLDENLFLSPNTTSEYEDDVSVTLRHIQFDSSILIQTDVSSSHILLQQDPIEYKKVFHTTYMLSMVKKISNKYANNFTLPNELQPQSISNSNVNTTLTSTCCCLCVVPHRKHLESFDFCIKTVKNLNLLCRKGKSSRNNRSLLKYQKRHICDECMYSMIANSKRTKSKKFRCLFPSCSLELNKMELHKHYIKHFGVKNLICNICEKEYASVSGLKKHERKHAL